MNIENNEDFLERVQRKEPWVRAVFMLLFCFLLWVVKIVFVTIMILQFLTVLITEQPNANLLKFSKTLSSYIHQICLFLSFHTEEKPFPFSDWPKSES